MSSRVGQKWVVRPVPRFERTTDFGGRTLTMGSMGSSLTLSPLASLAGSLAEPGMLGAGRKPCGTRGVSTSRQTTPPVNPLTSLSDEELLKSYRSGQRDGAAAFEELVRRHHDDLIRFLFRLTGNRALAEDAFQDTFLQVHLSADTFDVSRRFKPWLFTIAANKARDAMRRSARRRTLDLSAPIGGGGSGNGGGEGGERTFIDLMEINVAPPDAQLTIEERGRLVQRAVDELPWALREILLLAYFQRLSYNQIAEALEIPLGTVKSRLHSAVAAFASKWKSVSKDAGSPVSHESEDAAR